MKENNFKKDLKIANELFYTHEEHFKNILDLKKIFTIEDLEVQVLKELDINSGIDLIFKDNENRMRSVANRVQKCNKSWDSFTIRYKRFTGSKTEFEKRLYAIENNYMYPELTIQLYVNNKNEILNYCIIETKKLYKYVKENLETLTKRTTYDGNEFLVIPFSKVKEIKLKGYKND